MHTGKDTDTMLQIEGRHDNYTGRSDSGYNNHLTSSQSLEVKLFLDKISYFDGSNNKEALNFWLSVKKQQRK